METVFSHIIQKRLSQQNEDVASDALVYILNASEHARSGLMKLLRGIEPDLPDLQFQTQQAEGAIRPDVCGFDGSKRRVFIENKFWAGLTDNQPVSYLQQLASGEPPNVLLFVAPAAREHTLWRELLMRLHAAEIAHEAQHPPAGVVFSARTQTGVSLALTSWARLLQTLTHEAAEETRTMSDLSQLSALCDAADVEAFTPLSSEQISDHRQPAFILQLNTLVQAAVQAGVTRNILDLNGLRPQASWDRIGRYIRFAEPGDVIAWIGLHFTLWKQYGSPLWLVFYPDSSGGVDGVKRRLEPWAMETNRPASMSNEGFVLAVNVLSDSEKDQVVNSVVDLFGEINNLLAGASDDHRYHASEP